MNLLEKKDLPFYERFPYLLSNEFSYKFEGFSPEIQSRLENIVSKLGGKINESFTKIFVDKEYFEQEGNYTRKDLYDVKFITEVMKKKERLDVEEFRFIPIEKLPDPCCWMGKNILKTYPCTQFFYNNIRCTKCITLNINENISESDEPKIRSSRNLRDFLVDKLYREPSIESSVDIVENQNSKKLNILKNKSKIHSSKSPKEERTFNTDCKKLENERSRNLEWWKVKLQPEDNINAAKTREEGGKYRGSIFTEQEMRKMLVFLIQNGLLSQGDSTLSWKLCHQKNLMKNRTVESLRNNFKKKILRNIYNFNLPIEYITELEKVRDRVYKC